MAAIRRDAFWKWATFALTLAGIGAGLGGCVTNKATGRSQFDYLSREDEIALGDEAGPPLTQEYGGAVTDPRITSYVTGVGMSLAKQTEADYASLPWTFTLLNSPVINAFALPGGKVFVSRGLAEKFESEAQLAGVLGHEVGHVTAEHADRAISRQLGLTGIAIGLGVLAGSDSNMQVAAGVLVAGTGVFALRYSRDQESEADKLGMRYMVKAGYHPRGMLEVMQVLAEAAKGGGAPPEFLSTHPAPQTRIGEIQKRLDTTYAEVIKEKGDTLIVGEERFRAEFLEPMNRIPMPVQKPAQGSIDLKQPWTWCAHCAAARSRVGSSAGAGSGL